MLLHLRYFWRLKLCNLIYVPIITRNEGKLFWFYCPMQWFFWIAVLGPQKCFNSIFASFLQRECQRQICLLSRCCFALHFQVGKKKVRVILFLSITFVPKLMILTWRVHVNLSTVTTLKMSVRYGFPLFSYWHPCFGHFRDMVNKTNAVTQFPLLNQILNKFTSNIVLNSVALCCYRSGFFSSTCGIEVAPTVYTDVDYHMPWIKDVIRRNGGA